MVQCLRDTISISNQPLYSRQGTMLSGLHMQRDRKESSNGTKTSTQHT